MLTTNAHAQSTFPAIAIHVIVCYGIVLLVAVLGGCGTPSGDAFPQATRTAPFVLPSYPSARQVVTTERPGLYTSFPHQIITFQTTDSLEQVIGYYRTQLAPAGWVPVGSASLVNRQACPIYTLGFRQVADAIELDLFPEGCVTR